MSLRFGIFSADLDAVVASYTQVLGFSLVRDERAVPVGYVALERDEVQLGAAYRADLVDRSARRPPTGIEVVLEVDDVRAERDRVVARGWPLEEDLQDRPWGLIDFRILDPGGHYPRITQPASRRLSKPE